METACTGCLSGKTLEKCLLRNSWSESPLAESQVVIIQENSNYKQDDDENLECKLPLPIFLGVAGFSSQKKDSFAMLSIFDPVDCFGESIR